MDWPNLADFGLYLINLSSSLYFIDWSLSFYGLYLFPNWSESRFSASSWLPLKYSPFFPRYDHQSVLLPPLVLVLPDMMMNYGQIIQRILDVVVSWVWVIRWWEHQDNFTVLRLMDAIFWWVGNRFFEGGRQLGICTVINSIFFMILVCVSISYVLQIRLLLFCFSCELWL